ncbi:hypothetical protein E2C01_039242 [Portunus trituberculatus]|uniref:Uncharacterized protein n=1 Tax=Portunus trituberculatus TaxID=210409 RepID=A0A5B7FK89_PORTR|nr:hypothetical protein [Portunus trituberculatus]
MGVASIRLDNPFFVPGERVEKRQESLPHRQQCGWEELWGSRGAASRCVFASWSKESARNVWYAGRSELRTTVGLGGGGGGGGRDTAGQRTSRHPALLPLGLRARYVPTRFYLLLHLMLCLSSTDLTQTLPPSPTPPPPHWPGSLRPDPLPLPSALYLPLPMT